MEYSKAKVESNVKSTFFFQNILSKNCAKFCLSGLYNIYHINALCTYRNIARECASLHDNVMQILSPMEPWAFLLVHIYIYIYIYICIYVCVCVYVYVLPYFNPKIW